MAARARHPNNRETLEHFAATWLSLAADELNQVGRQAKQSVPARAFGLSRGPLP
jgi:hypothetical protein